MSGRPEPAWWQDVLDSLGPAPASREVPYPARTRVEQLTAWLCESDAGAYFLLASSVIEGQSATTVAMMRLGELPDETLLDLTHRGRDPRIVQAFGTRWYLFNESTTPEEHYAEAVVAHATVTWLRTALEQGTLADALRAWRQAARGAQLCEALLRELHRRMAGKRTDYVLANLLRHHSQDGELAEAAFKAIASNVRGHFQSWEQVDLEEVRDDEIAGLIAEMRASDHANVAVVRDALRGALGKKLGVRIKQGLIDRYRREKVREHEPVGPLVGEREEDTETETRTPPLPDSLSRPGFPRLILTNTQERKLRNLGEVALRVLDRRLAGDQPTPGTIAVDLGLGVHEVRRTLTVLRRELRSLLD